MNISAILFDLDGTLVDSAPDLAHALNTLLAENGLNSKPYSQIKPLVALGARVLVKFGFDCDESDPEFKNRHQRVLQIYRQNIDKFSKPFAGIEALIKIIKQQKIFWGVVTNKPEDLAHLLLDKLGLKPDVVVGGDTLAFNKPHPAPLLYATAQLSVLPSQCLFIGDDENDIIAGRNAQIKTVAVRYGYGTVFADWGYDFVVDKPEEITQWIL